MAPHTGITTWSLVGSDSDHVISPAGSATHSVVSVDTILSDTYQKYLGVNEIPQAAESQINSQAVRPFGNKASVSKYPGIDDPFIRHSKYFFADGNVTFLVEGTLYCVHRYFFSRDSTYFSTRFAQLDIRDHEALPTIISLSDVESKDFEAFISILYPENFEQNHLSYEEWKSVLHLSTRWDFSSIRKLALSSIEPEIPTSHDRLLLARKHSVDDWVVPALSELCERTTPLTLSEARQMNVEDIILVSTVREDIRGRMLQVDPAAIPCLIKAEQASALAGREPRPFQAPPALPASEPSSPMDLKVPAKKDDTHESGGKRSIGPNFSSFSRARGDNGIDEHLQTKQEGELAATRMVEGGAPTWTTGNIATQLADDLAAKRMKAAAAAERRMAEEKAAKRKAKKAAKRKAEKAEKRKAEKAAKRKAEKAEKRKAEEAKRKAMREARREVQKVRLEAARRKAEEGAVKRESKKARRRAGASER